MKKQIKSVGTKEFLPRIVIKCYDSLELHYEDAAIQEYFSKNASFPWQKLANKFPGITIGKLFNAVRSEEIERIVEKAKKSNPEYHPPNFLSCFAIDCTDDKYVPELLAEIVRSELIEYAYVESEAPPPDTITETNQGLREQGYLNRASEGIDAKYAWRKPGGDGQGNVKFIDIEQGWALQHEDLPTNIPVLYGVNSDFLWHGTSVLGILFMQPNGKGGLGIAHGAKPQVISQIVEKTDARGHVRKTNIINDAILQAIDLLEFGDVLLLEAQYMDEQFKLWPYETRRMTFDLIGLATAKGIIVIEPAANGEIADNPVGNNLDDFTNAWGKKILNRTPSNADFRDSGAIMVAGASHSGEHTKTTSTNFGNRIDCFAWGNSVFTADDPALHQNGQRPYWDNFDGTSSASAIIAGAAIIVQSMIDALGKPRLSPAQMRDILSGNGTASDRIGVMPDLRRIINAVLPSL